MLYPTPLVSGTIINRYKRFLCDIELENKELITAHVANTGSMTSCWAPGWKVLMSYHPDSKRKYAYSLELTHNGHSWIAVNTSLTNKLALDCLLGGFIPEIEVNEYQAEYTVGQSRLDFLVRDSDKNEIYIEVKNVTLKAQDDFATFPDAVSTRGQKHLQELTELRAKGKRAAMLYIVPREDVHTFTPALDIDPDYAQLLKLAYDKGVEIYVVQCGFYDNQIVPLQRLPYVFLSEEGEFM